VLGATILFAGVLSTLHLEGDVTQAGGDYLVVPFAVPAGTVELEIDRQVTVAGTILDFGVWSPSGFRGWGGGLTESTVIGVDDSSRGYLPGPIAVADWQLVIGKANLGSTGSSHYLADLTFRDSATLVPRARATTSGAALRSGPRWFAGDLHVHSSESGDAHASFDQIVSLARSRHLDFVVLSDHNTVSQHGLIAAMQPSVPDVLLMRGAEVTTYAGHGNALGASVYIDHRIGLDGRTAAALVHDVGAAGGLFVINHPVLDLGSACIGCAWNHSDTPWNEVGALEIQTGSYPLGVSLFLTRALALWDLQLDAGAHLAAVGGSDDHRAGTDTGPTASEVGSPTTWVWASELSEAGILAGIRAGHTVVSLRGPDDPRLELYTTDATPRLIGDLATGGRVEVEVHVRGGAGSAVELVLNGSKIPGPVQVDSDDFRRRFTVSVPPAGGRLRAQLASGGDPIVISSHLYLAYAAPTGCALGGAAGSPWSLAMFAFIAFVFARRRYI